MTAIKNDIHSVSAFAPATCANIAVGFDILGFAIDGIGDTITLVKRTDSKIVIEEIKSHDKLPLVADKNCASIVIQKICDDLKLNQGFSIFLQKGIPLSSGMGGSAASSVAAAVACNAFLEEPLSLKQLAQYALFGEEISSGTKHVDNIIPSLYGGLTLISSVEPLEVVSLPIPKVFCALVHPHLFVETKQARKILNQDLALKDYIAQSAYLASFIASLYTQNLTLLQKSLVDVIIEPQRAQFVPGYFEIKENALKAGALGLFLSGSGPSLMSFVKSKEEARAVIQSITTSLKNNGISSDHWISVISQQAAHII